MIRLMQDAALALAFLGLGAGGNEALHRSAEAETVRENVVPPADLEPSSPALISSAWWAETGDPDTPRAIAVPSVQLVHPPAVSVAPVPAVVTALPPAPVAPVALALRVEAPVASGEAAVRQALAQSSWPAHLWEWVIRIARCESGLRTNPPGGDGGRSVGLMQINTAPNAHPDLAWRFDLRSLAGNLEAAWIVYTQRGGAQPWSCK